MGRGRWAQKADQFGRALCSRARTVGAWRHRASAIARCRADRATSAARESSAAGVDASERRSTIDDAAPGRCTRTDERYATSAGTEPAPSSARRGSTGELQLCARQPNGSNQRSHEQPGCCPAHRTNEDDDDSATRPLWQPPDEYRSGRIAGGPAADLERTAARHELRPRRELGNTERWSSVRATT